MSDGGPEEAWRLEGLCWSGLSQATGQQEALGAEWSVCRAEPEGVPLAEGPCPANDMVLCLLHSCLGQELSDREIPLSTTDQAAFLSEVLRRTCHSPGKLPTSFLIPDSGPAPFLPTPQGGFCLGFDLLLASPQSPSSLLPLPFIPIITSIVGPEGPQVGGHGIRKDQSVSTQATGDLTLPTLVSTDSSP